MIANSVHTTFHIATPLSCHSHCHSLACQFGSNRSYHNPRCSRVATKRHLPESHSVIRYTRHSENREIKPVCTLAETQDKLIQEPELPNSDQQAGTSKSGTSTAHQDVGAVRACGGEQRRRQAATENGRGERGTGMDPRPWT